MTANTQHESLSTALGELESTMKTLGLWSSVCPSHESLDSVEPFGYDKLELQEWLQWIMIPRFRALLDSHGALPTVSNVAEYAEMKFANPKFTPVIADLRNVDSCINNGPICKESSRV